MAVSVAAAAFDPSNATAAPSCAWYARVFYTSSAQKKLKVSELEWKLPEEYFDALADKDLPTLTELLSREANESFSDRLYADNSGRVAKLVETFVTEHCIVFEVFTLEEISVIRDRLAYVVSKEFPEFTEESLWRTLGSFSAFGNASSFHHPELRALRVAVATRSACVVEAIGRKLGHAYVHELVDRLGFRPSGVAVTGESEHRDRSPLGKQQLGTDVAGSMVNLNLGRIEFHYYPQSAILGAQLKERARAERGSAGFCKVTDSETAKNWPFSVKVVPPGYRCLFLQNILHSVAKSVVPPANAKTGFYGLWRLYQSVAWADEPDEPLFGRAYFDQVIESQAAFLLPSGQAPPLYPSCYLQYSQQRRVLETFARTMDPLLLRFPGGDSDKLAVPVRFMTIHKPLDKYSPFASRQGQDFCRATLRDDNETFLSHGFPGCQFSDWTDEEMEVFLPRAVGRTEVSETEEEELDETDESMGNLEVALSTPAPLRAARPQVGHILTSRPFFPAGPADHRSKHAMEPTAEHVLAEQPSGEIQASPASNPQPAAAISTDDLRAQMLELIKRKDMDAFHRLWVSAGKPAPPAAVVEMAVKSKDPGLVRKLLDMGGKFRERAYHWATTFGDTEMLGLLNEYKPGHFLEFCAETEAARDKIKSELAALMALAKAKPIKNKFARGLDSGARAMKMEAEAKRLAEQEKKKAGFG